MAFTRRQADKLDGRIYFKSSEVQLSMWRTWMSTDLSANLKTFSCWLTDWLNGCLASWYYPLLNSIRKCLYFSQSKMVSFLDKFPTVSLQQTNPVHTSQQFYCWLQNLLLIHSQVSSLFSLPVVEVLDYFWVTWILSWLSEPTCYHLPFPLLFWTAGDWLAAVSSCTEVLSELIPSSLLYFPG